MNFVPSSDRVLVKLTVLPEKTHGGIYVPETARQNLGCRIGKVVAVGPGRWVNGHLVPTGFEVDQTVALDQIGGMTVKVGGDELIILRSEEILGRYEGI